MMRKARRAIRKVNVALDSPGYCFGTGRSLKLVCFPALTDVLPLTSTSRFAHLCCSRPRGSILAASLAALPSMSLLPRSPLIRSFPRISSVTITDVTVHLARSHASIVEALQVVLAPAEPGGIS